MLQLELLSVFPSWMNIRVNIIFGVYFLIIERGTFWALLVRPWSYVLRDIALSKDRCTRQIFHSKKGFNSVRWSLKRLFSLAQVSSRPPLIDGHAPNIQFLSMMACSDIPFVRKFLGFDSWHLNISVKMSHADLNVQLGLWAKSLRL